MSINTSSAIIPVTRHRWLKSQLAVRLSACGTGAIQSSHLPSNNRNKFNYIFYWDSRFFVPVLFRCNCVVFPPPTSSARRQDPYLFSLYFTLRSSRLLHSLLRFQHQAFSLVFLFLIPVLLHCLVIVLDYNFFLPLCHLPKDAGCIILFLTVSVVHTNPPSATLHLSTRLPWNLRYREPIRSRVTLL